MINRIQWSISLALMICWNLNASDIRITEILILGNKITKDFIILRELPFSAGEIFTEEALIKHLQVATENLNNTSLFNYVYTDYLPDISAVISEADGMNALDYAGYKSCIVTIRVEERWYLWPQLSIKFEDRNLSNWLHEKDFSRLTIGAGVWLDNIWGLRHTLSNFNYLGFQKGFRLSYSNIAIDKKRTQMLSFHVASLYKKTINVISENDKVIYVKDPDNYLDRTFEGDINYSYRPGIRNTHRVNVGFQRIHLGDTVLKINPHYWGTDKLTNNLFKVTYTFSHEHRDYAVYPTKGYFTNTEVKTIAADDFHFFYGSLILRLQYYKDLSTRWFWSSRLNAGVTFRNKQANFLDRNVGYDEKNIIGYDYYVIDGPHFAILNNDIRFCLMPKRIFNVGSWDKLRKFSKIHFALYAKLSYDMAYINDKYRQPSNTLANTYIWGSGIGLDLATYYDIVLNCSYAINKIGERGLFFGIKAPIF